MQFWPFTKKRLVRPHRLDITLRLIELARDRLDDCRCDTHYRPTPQDFEKLNRIADAFHRGYARTIFVTRAFAARVETRPEGSQALKWPG